MKVEKTHVEVHSTDEVICCYHIMAANGIAQTIGVDELPSFLYITTLYQCDKCRQVRTVTRAVATHPLRMGNLDTLQ